MWAGHITDWSLLDYNRHSSSLTKTIRPQWNATYHEDTPEPWLA
jgi:hypothetical protein